jgi:beta-glucanase (GH16 family)
MKMTIFALLLSASCISCGGGDDSDEVVLPTNLTFTAEVDGATVNVTATANAANFYTISFGVAGTTVKSNDGKASYTYSESGTYSILVKAHATDADFISSNKQVIIDIDVPIVDEGYTTPETYDGYNLVWQDEFSGTTLNTANWTHETGNGSGGWGNNELEYYRPENTKLRDGYMIITARSESYQGKSFTSSRIITKGKQEFLYGRIDIRAKLPKGQGIWPALWMLGSNISTVGWPKCGEIDIMEMVGGQGRENTIKGTLHWDHEGTYACTCDKLGKTLSTGIFPDKFHVYTLTWDATFIKWYVDDELFETIDITPAGLSEFHAKQFFIFNVAVGGNWPGSPDATTKFPQQMIVDYVRVFQPQ